MTPCHHPLPQGACPVGNTVGPQPRVLHSTTSDPLDRFPGICGLAGSAKIKALNNRTMHDHAYREFGEELLQKALVVTPNIPKLLGGMTYKDMVRHIHTAQGLQGGLLQGDPNIHIYTAKIDWENLFFQSWLYSDTLKHMHMHNQANIPGA
jgi:hypothetical protein